MNGSFRMKVAAALSLILSLSAARSRGAMVTVQSGGALLVQSRSNIVFVNSLNVPENRGKTVVSVLRQRWNCQAKSPCVVIRTL